MNIAVSTFALVAALCGSSAVDAQAATSPSTPPAAGQPAETTTQTSPPADPAAQSVPASAPTEAGTPDIVVTATRREQALQDVPIAVTALTAGALGEARINTSADLMQIVPNLNITSSVGAVIVYLRGVGQTATNPGQEPSVATYVDGVYQPTVFGALTGLANVQRVEVIKGPQGTLFGRNATGGLISITTRDPSQHPSLDITASYGNFDTARVSAYGTIGITPAIAADLAIYFNDQDKGVGYNVTTGHRLRGTRNIDVRSKILIEASPTTTIRFAGSYTDNKSSVGNALAVLPGSVSYDGTTALRNFYDIQTTVDPSDHNRTWQVSAKVQQEFGAFDVTSTSSYTDTRDFQFYDDDGTPTRLITATISQYNKIFTQEFQIGSKKGAAFTWQAGVFYYNSIGRGLPTGVQLNGLAFAPLDGVRSRGDLKTTSIAGYAEGTYAFTPKLNLTIGARYTSDKKTLSGSTSYLDASGNVLQTIPIAGASATFNEPTYRAILDYHLTKDILTYASYSHGFKSGGYDTGFPNGIAFRPEKIDAYEIGMKNEFFGRRVRLNIAAFYYDYKDLQLPILVTTNGSSQVTLNAANSTVKGVDLDGSIRVSRAFDFNYGFGYLDSRYENFPNAPCTRRNASGMTQQYACDVSGNTTIHAPKTTFNLGGAYRLETGIGRFTTTASYSHFAKSYFDVADRIAQPAYGLLNGQISWSPRQTTYSIAVFAQNLTDEKYTVSQFAQGGINDSYAAGLPRMYGVEVKAKF